MFEWTGAGGIFFRRYLKPSRIKNNIIWYIIKTTLHISYTLGYTPTPKPNPKFHLTSLLSTLTQTCVVPTLISPALFSTSSPPPHFIRRSFPSTSLDLVSLDLYVLNLVSLNLYALDLVSLNLGVLDLAFL